LTRSLEAVFGKKVHVVPLIKNLTVDSGVEFAQPPCLAILLGDELLIKCCDLDEEVVLRQVKVGSELGNSTTFFVEFDVKGPRLVLPFDLIEVKQSCELAL